MIRKTAVLNPGQKTVVSEGKKKKKKPRRSTFFSDFLGKELKDWGPGWEGVLFIIFPFYIYIHIYIFLNFISGI